MIRKSVYNIFKYTCLIVVGIPVLFFICVGACIWGIILYGATESCYFDPSEVSGYLELEECYQVDIDALSKIRNTELYEITGMSKHQIVYSAEKDRVCVSRSANLSDPLRSLKYYGFSVDGVETETEYIKYVNETFDGYRFPLSEKAIGEWKQCVIYLNEDRSFFCVIEIGRVELEGEYNGTYVVRPMGESRFYILRDRCGFYYWLDNNVFSETYG